MMSTCGSEWMCPVDVRVRIAVWVVLDVLEQVREILQVVVGTHVVEPVLVGVALEAAVPLQDPVPVGVNVGARVSVSCFVNVMFGKD